MKAEIHPNGTLVVIPESGTEAFALSQWDYEKHCLMIVKAFPPPDPLAGHPVNTLGGKPPTSK